MKRCWWICGGLGILALLAGEVLWRQGLFHPAPPAAFIKPADEQAVQYLKVMLSTWKANAQESMKPASRP